MFSAVENTGHLHITVVLAMSADGKIGDACRTAARFPSLNDKRHLEACLAQADATLLGAGTLRAYRTTLTISNPQLLHQRQQRGLPPQPIHIVCSRSGALDPTWRFFSQPICRWLVTTTTGAQVWQTQSGFDRILEIPDATIDWRQITAQFHALGLQRLVVMGGGELVASLVAYDLVEEFWLTLCPVLIGGRNAPTPLDGEGFLTDQAPWLQLVSVSQEGDEIFLHYRRHSGTDSKIQLP